MLARGHILLEGLPGLGKTELVKGLSKLLHLGTKRVQFTPDLLPGDITGNPVLQEIDGRREFVFQPGPLFTNIVLADEINRASPKTQSALLEAMQERRVTVLGKTHELPKPFFVLATQNPIELEGTYPLPEAQLDRFLFKLEVTRNDVEHPATHRFPPRTRQRAARGTGHDRGNLQRAAGTRAPHLSCPPSSRTTSPASWTPPTPASPSPPRASATAPARAPRSRSPPAPRPAPSCNERTNASFEDVKAIAPAVLRHRIVLDYNARVEGRTTEDIIRDLLEEVPFQASATPKVLTAKS